MFSSSFIDCTRDGYQDSCLVYFKQKNLLLLRAMFICGKTDDLRSTSCFLSLSYLFHYESAWSSNDFTITSMQLKLSRVSAINYKRSNTFADEVFVHELLACERVCNSAKISNLLFIDYFGEARCWV